MDNKELIALGASFFIVIGLAMYMFVSQQKNNNMVKEANELKELIEKNRAEVQASIDSLTVRMDETDVKYHTNN